MARFKMQGTGLLDTETNTWIPPGHPYWEDRVQPWLDAGNVPDPEHTVDELARLRIAEVRAEAQRRSAELTTTSPVRVHKLAKLLRRRISGTITPAQNKQLVDIEALDDQLDDIDGRADAAERWLEDPARTMAEIEAYRPAVDPWA